MYHNRKLPFFLLLSIALNLFALWSPAVQPVQAGSNGQQIYFSCKTYFQGVSPMDYVIIRGTNQNGTQVEWQGYARWENGDWATYVFPKGWWWIGKVRIYWWVARNNHWYSAVYEIPKVSSFDEIPLKCGLY